jgi:hypothetical protein
MPCFGSTRLTFIFILPTACLAARSLWVVLLTPTRFGLLFL